MSTRAFVRLARKVVGLTPQREFASLEALLEAEADLPTNDFFIAARVAPAVIFLVGVAMFLPLGIRNIWQILAMTGIYAALAGGLWFLLDRMDKAIPRSKFQLRKSAKEISHRYNELGAILSPEQALSPAVGEVLDEAARITLKHSAKSTTHPKDLLLQTEARGAAALDEAMAKMLELARPVGGQAQEAELASGWALPLLKEMRELDRELDTHAQRGLAASVGGASGAISGVREARLELQRIDQAIEELTQTQDA